jgi:diketogulonate reductase-like aldo/keto reductase
MVWLLFLLFQFLLFWRIEMASSIKNKLPGKMIYGTAWKQEKTSEYVIQAINSGFRAIDTACQPKHYNEPGVGDALRYLYTENLIQRHDLFLQTKFTSIHGQDPTK